jgi:hypothetical protein
LCLSIEEGRGKNEQRKVVEKEQMRDVEEYMHGGCNVRM